MFGHKHRKELKEEAQREGLKETKDLEVDESNLSEEEKGKTVFPWTFLIIAGVILLAMIAFLIVILVNKSSPDAISEKIDYISQTGPLLK